MLRSHYGKQPGTPPGSSGGENRTPFIPSPSADQNISSDKDKDDDEVENYDERAPFIPLTIDSELDCDDELLVEIPFIDSPMTPSPSSWLLNADESIPSPGSLSTFLPPILSSKAIRPTSLSASSSPETPRKGVPTAVKKNSYVTNEIPSKGKVSFPYISSWDAEVNAPVQHCGLLQGDELIRALECGNFL